MYKMHGLPYKDTDNLKLLVDAVNSNSELRELIHKICTEVDMPIGDNIFTLPGLIKKMRKNKEELRKSLIRAEAKVIASKEEVYDGW